MSVYSNRKAQILGPNSTTFHKRSTMELPLRAYRNWQSGRATTPAHGILYAPAGTPNVSLTYFDDEARRLSSTIAVFAPPAIEEVLATGLAWGLSANISCSLLHPNKFRMFTIIEPDGYRLKFNISSLEQCLSKTASTGCNETFNTNLRNETGDFLLGSKFQSTAGRFPNWYDDSGTTRTGMEFSHLVAADGDHGSHEGPFTRQSGYDPFTYDALLLGRPSDEMTTAIFEFFLWEWPAHRKADGTFYDPDREYTETSIHCDIRSAVGQALIDPLSRTYANFTRGNATTNPFDSEGIVRILDVVPPQVIAVNALSNGPNHIDLESTTYAYQSSASTLR